MTVFTQVYIVKCKQCCVDMLFHTCIVCPIPLQIFQIYEKFGNHKNSKCRFYQDIIYKEYPKIFQVHNKYTAVLFIEA